MVRLRTILAVVGTMACAAACSALVSLDDLTGGPGPDGGPDKSDATGATDAPAGGTDAASDGNSDGGPVDGGADQIVPPDAPVTFTFCKTVSARFCDDFERTPPVLGLWTGVGAAGGGVVALAPNPQGGTLLSATVPAFVAGARVAYLLYDTPDTFTEGDVSLDVTMPTTFSAGSFHPFVIDILGAVAGTTEREFNVTVKATLPTTLSAHTVYADGGLTNNFVEFSGGIPLGKTVRLRVHAKLNAPAAITAYLDGNQAATLSPPAEFGPGRVELRVGIEGTATTVPPLTETSDNVVLSY